LGAARDAAKTLLILPQLSRVGFTDLEVVAFYALFQDGKIPTATEAEKDAQTGAKLAVWQAVHPEVR
jgi:hypothetical protein